MEILSRIYITCSNHSVTTLDLDHHHPIIHTWLEIKEPFIMTFQIPL